MTAEELNELLERADRSKAWLARHLGVAERTVQRWADPDSPWPVPSARDDRIRLLLEPSLIAAERDQALTAADRATAQAERYGDAIVAIHEALPNVNRVRLILAGLDTGAP